MPGAAGAADPAAYVRRAARSAAVYAKRAASWRVNMQFTLAKGSDVSRIRHQCEPIMRCVATVSLSISHTSSGPDGVSEPYRCHEATTSSSRRPTR
ncbi:hypothetical protein AMK33_37270 [Streptomyces sp. CB02400]|nr:hypothetical protein AMK33_37270 [Streptomyces sp. CB02400]